MGRGALLRKEVGRAVVGGARSSSAAFVSPASQVGSADLFGVDGWGSPPGNGSAHCDRAMTSHLALERAPLFFGPLLPHLGCSTPFNHCGAWGGDRGHLTRALFGLSPFRKESGSFLCKGGSFFFF